MMSKLSDMFEDKKSLTVSNSSFFIKKQLPESCISAANKKTVNIIAMGDVGGTLATGLCLIGGSVISNIGLYDINDSNAKRYAFELGQIASCSSDEDGFHLAVPTVNVVSDSNLFNCDIILFCASLGVPKVGEVVKDVRMIQLEKNKALIKSFAKRAVQENYLGKFYVVSDPVDPLCKAALMEGLLREQVRGFGLGVMNARAIYYSKKSTNSFIMQYPSEGRAFGPHGGGLVIANSIESYNDAASIVLTQQAETANLEMRELGFKPYIAPALSSGAISIVDLLHGRWHYSSIYYGKNDSGAFWGCKNKENPDSIEIEDLKLDNKLMERIKDSYTKLSGI